MAKKRVAINGFGRIGRLALRTNYKNKNLDIVSINDPGAIEELAVLLKYDSVYGIFEADVKVEGENLIIDGQAIQVTQVMDPVELPHAANKVDIVLECTGIFEQRDLAAKHIQAGAKKVIISSPGKEVDGTFCMGINQELYDSAKHQIISNASCTTNCLAPVAKVLDENFGIVKGTMTTAHSYTNDQKLTDATHKKDYRRARAANLSMIPTTTGAAKAIGEVLPGLKGKLDGVALRVPTPTVSIVDLVVEVSKNTTIEEVNQAFTKASQNELKGILGVTSEPLVSIDFRGDDRSSIVDLPLTNVMGGNLVKVMSWYDNEWGYSMRLIEMAEMVANQM
jgi:glyceraldehyde 3-phosphate dehydrogenase